MSFGGLLAAYGAIRIGSVDWPNAPEILGVNLPGFMTFLLICSSLTMVKAITAVKQGDMMRFRRHILLNAGGGFIFLGLQVYEWTHLINQGLLVWSNPWGSSLFGATFFAITGFHGMHVTGGVIYLICVYFEGKSGRYDGGRFERVEVAGLYWHFVDLVWILVFTFIYLL